MRVTYSNVKVKQFIQDNIDYVVLGVNKISAFLFKKFGIITSSKIKERIEDIEFIFSRYYVDEYNSVSMVNINPIMCFLKAYKFFCPHVANHCHLSKIDFDSSKRLFKIECSFVGFLIGEKGALMDNVTNLLNLTFDDEDKYISIEFIQRKKTSYLK